MAKKKVMHCSFCGRTEAQGATLLPSPTDDMLITGTAGSGKSTTQACIIDRIRRTRSGHIITLEDPIEYLYNYRDVDLENIKAKCIVSQREVGSDTNMISRVASPTEYAGIIGEVTLSCI